MIGAAIEATVTRTSASPNAPASAHAQPPSSAPNTDAIRPTVEIKIKLSDANLKFDAYQLLGINAVKAADVLAELKAVERDPVAVALVLNPALVAKAKAELDPTVAKDLGKITKVINGALEQVTVACTKAVTGAPSAS